MLQMWDTEENALLMLSEVMDEIGVNEKMVMKRRRAWLMMEVVDTLSQYKIRGNINEIYYFGSQIEGTTTLGLQSDCDVLHLHKNLFNIIQDLRDWKPGVINLLMIQDDMTSPGYCLLQILRTDAPLPAYSPIPLLNNMDQHRYSYDKIVLKHSVIKFDAKFPRRGPSYVSKHAGCLNMDMVVGFPINTMPYSLKRWLSQQSHHGQLPEDMVKDIKSRGCFVVAAGRKGSPNETLEWRISTSHAERCAMFSLNITQIRCFVLMKMIIKTYLKHQSYNGMTSFICKNILLLNVAKTKATDWNARNLMTCLKTCLCNMKECIQQDSCPHFIMHENNLLLGKFSPNEKKWLLDSIDHILRSSDFGLAGVEIDVLGERLFSKLSSLNNMCPDLYREKRRYTSLNICGYLVNSCAVTIYTSRAFIFTSSQKLSHTLKTLESVYEHGTKQEQEACFLIKPLICSSLGNELASKAIQNHSSVTPKILEILRFGTNSDVSSGRLKLASVLYSMGDMHGAEQTLREIAGHFEKKAVTAICGCHPFQTVWSSNFLEYSYLNNENALRDVVAFAVVFRKSEIHCIPRELRYEMFRSTRADVSRRSLIDRWMDWAVVDSLVYMYFLQYKVYVHFQK